MDTQMQGKRTTKNSLGLRGLPEHKIIDTFKKLGMPESDSKRFKSTATKTVKIIEIDKNANVNKFVLNPRYTQIQTAETVNNANRPAADSPINRVFLDANALNTIQNVKDRKKIVDRKTGTILMQINENDGKIVKLSSASSVAKSEAKLDNLNKVVPEAKKKKLTSITEGTANVLSANPVKPGRLTTAERKYVYQHVVAGPSTSSAPSTKTVDDPNLRLLTKAARKIVPIDKHVVAGPSMSSALSTKAANDLKIAIQNAGPAKPTANNTNIKSMQQLLGKNNSEQQFIAKAARKNQYPDFNYAAPVNPIPPLPLTRTTVENIKTEPPLIDLTLTNQVLNTQKMHGVTTGTGAYTHVTDDMLANRYDLYGLQEEKANHLAVTAQGVNFTTALHLLQLNQEVLNLAAAKKPCIRTATVKSATATLNNDRLPQFAPLVTSTPHPINQPLIQPGAYEALKTVSAPAVIQTPVTAPKKTKTVNHANYLIVKSPTDINCSVPTKLKLKRTSNSPIASSLSRSPKMTPEMKIKHYHELLALEDSNGIVPNFEPFDCVICYVPIEVKEGVVLRNCLHKFCKDCLIQTIVHSDDVNIKCPYTDGNAICEDALQDREIRALLTKDEHERYLMRTLCYAENNLGNTFHCKKPNCIGWCICEDQINQFDCPICNSVNCITCAAIHPKQNCKQYQDDLKLGADEQLKTANALKKLVDDGQAMHCPNCNIVIMKREGCDWLKCTMCRTEICWATKMRRWGPNGVGDTSDGCKCKVGGKRCHPTCTNCH